MADLKSAGLIYLKGVLFAAIVVCCAVMLFLTSPTWRTALLIGLLVWASARFYYFLFYVIEKYVDDQYRFSGVISFIRYAVRRRRKG